jgi:hypothetical protein
MLVMIQNLLEKRCVVTMGVFASEYSRSERTSSPLPGPSLRWRAVSHTACKDTPDNGLDMSLQDLKAMPLAS